MIAPWTPLSFAIDANAGYGKTETLCTRLLAHFLTDPRATRNTVALTFTRAAAAEIYTRMLQLIVTALSSSEEMEKLRGKFHDLVYTDAFAGVDAADLRALLKRLIADMDELRISTIDSFFYRLVRAYAVELGLPGRVEMDPAGGDSSVTRELMLEFFRRSAGNPILLKACRESRFGRDEKLYFDSCGELLKTAMKFRSRLDEADLWGRPFLNYVPPDGEALRQALELCDAHRDEIGENYDTDLRPLLAACRDAHSADHHFSADELKDLRAFLAVWKTFPATSPAGFAQNWQYPEPAASAIRTLIDNGRRILIHQCAMRTAALRAVLKEYSALYDRLVIRRGRINFADLPLLLSESLSDPDGDPRRELARRREFLNEVQYRTNSRFRHFLIDEFQDTSRDQWRILDPITEDPGDNDHTLFIVGDVKQAIYGWREGDSKLMGDVKKWRGMNDAEHSRPLPCSYRYGSDICEALNLFFGGDPGNSAVSRFIGDLREADAEVPPEILDGIADRWGRTFAEHRADPEKTKPGEFRVMALVPSVVSGTADDGEDDFAVAVAKLIFDRLAALDIRDAGNRPVGFFGSGLSGGVLVRSNKDGVKLRDAMLELRPDLADSIVWEADEKIVSDPLVASLLALGVWLQHPADTFAREVVMMNQLLRDIAPAPSERLPWLSVLSERGVAGFLRHALKRLDARSVAWDQPPAAEWNPVENGNVDTLLVLAENFDAAGGERDFLRFRDLAASASKPPAPIAGKLRLLTIHHSKGLSFDVVFHPMFPSPRGGNWKKPDLHEMIAGVPDSGAPPAWVLNAPREEGMTVKDISDAVMARHADSCFEELCDLYVALTRARRGMYVFLPPLNQDKAKKFHQEWKNAFENRPPEYRSNRWQRLSPARIKNNAAYLSDFVFETAFFTSQAFSPDAELPYRPGPDGIRYLERTFGGPWSAKLKKATETFPPLEVEFADGGARVRRAAPSELQGEKKLFFALPSADAGTNFGTSVHAFFERIGRWNEFQAPDDTPEEVLAHYGACSKNPELVALLGEPCELWRERRFDVVLTDADGNKALVSGCFDRVQIVREGGAVARACIIDYKSNQAEESELPALVQHYAPQLETYRSALAVLLGITPNLIDCRIVFTRYGKIFAV